MLQLSRNFRSFLLAFCDDSVDSSRESCNNRLQLMQTKPGSARCQIPVKGMTCSSCTSTIENHLRELPGVHEVSVSLLLERADVIYDPLLQSPEKLVSEICDLGFEATAPPPLVHGSSISFCSISISGMTCTSCSTSIENHLRSLRGVRSATVSLMLERADVEYDGQVLSADDIASAVEEVGFEATVKRVTVGAVLLSWAHSRPRCCRTCLQRALVRGRAKLGTCCRVLPQR